jgi:FMN reductase
MGAVINTAGPVFDEAGACVDASARFQLELVGRQVTEFARLRMAGPLPAPLA